MMGTQVIVFPVFTRQERRMMSFHSIHEILRFAMARENASRRFYLDLSRSVTNPGTQAIFEALANAEGRQLEAVRLELFKIGSTVSSPDQAPDPSSPQDQPELNRQSREMSAPDALKLAMRKQKASFQMFAELMAHTDNPEAAEMLYGLAEQEMRHLLKLEKEYKALAPRRENP
jgi:rubrerythrin